MDYYEKVGDVEHVTAIGSTHMHYGLGQPGFRCGLPIVSSTVYRRCGCIV